MKKKEIIVLMLSAMMVLTACVSEKPISQVEVSETKVIAEIKVEEIVEKETSVEAETMGETSMSIIMEEIAEEESVETIVYEGIDMESTLPAGEWVATFLDVIDEPKFVITNEETNKKLIVEDGQEAVLEKGDALGLYSPGGILGGYSGVEVTDTTTFGDFYTEFELGLYKSNSTFEVTIATIDGLEYISCILVWGEEIPLY